MSAAPFHSARGRYAAVATVAGGALSGLRLAKEAKEMAEGAISAFNYLVGPTASGEAQRVGRERTRVFNPNGQIKSRSKKNIVGKQMPARKSKKTSSRKSKKTKKSGKSRKTTRKTLAKDVRALKKAFMSDQATHIRRYRVTSKSICNPNGVGYNAYATLGASDVEAAMSVLRYYDPAAPGTLVTANAATGTYTRQVHFAYVKTHTIARNNYQVPVWCELWTFMPKYDTNVTPITYYTDGITDQVISGATDTPLVTFSDINQVKDNWTWIKKSKLLQPGEQLHSFYFGKAFDFDPANYDTHSLAYQKKYRAANFVCRVEGALQHDTVQVTEQTTGIGAVDILFDIEYKMIYDAGVNLNDISYSNLADSAFTTGGVCSVFQNDNYVYTLA